MASLTPSTTRPLTSLLLFFAFFKAYLLLIAVGASVAPDYDTSTALSFHRAAENGTVPRHASLPQRLTRWDAIYFMSSARYGYVFEQEWAFGPGLPFLTFHLSKLCRNWLGAGPNPGLESMIGTAVAHIAHLITVLTLYSLTLRVSRDRRLAFVSAMLHIVSPAGLFLSAPYQEAPFMCLTFLGHLLYVSSLDTASASDLKLVGAGILYGLSTTFRSNGLLSGIVFAAEALFALQKFIQYRKACHLIRLTASIVGGICLAAGSIVPQYFAWLRYCSQDVSRPWCSNMVPSIYSFVQEAYWNVGFLRYWTLDQLPLFILATPVLCMLMKSGSEAIQRPASVVQASGRAFDHRMGMFVQMMAISQTVLAILAITTYHVQIITRISSAYPVWYWWVGTGLLKGGKKGIKQSIPIFMVLYASVQGGLFASFLPPA